MSIFQTRITHARVSFSAFTAENMLAIGQATLDHIKGRIKEAKDVNDGHAKDLTRAYKTAKTRGRRVAGSGLKKFQGLPLRDWTLRGQTLGTIFVKNASDYKCTLGPIYPTTALLMTVRNRTDQMWGMSPSDYEAMYKAVGEQLVAHKFITVEKGNTTTSGTAA